MSSRSVGAITLVLISSSVNFGTKSLEKYIRVLLTQPPSASLRVLLDVSHGLLFLHEQNVVHRDVKPANILIMQDGRAKLRGDTRNPSFRSSFSSSVYSSLSIAL